MRLAILAAAIAVVCKAVDVMRENSRGARLLLPHTVDLRDSDGSTEAYSSSPDPSNPTLRVGIAPVISPERSLSLYEGLVAYLGRVVGRQAVMVQRQSYAEINNLVQHGWCDVAFVCAYPFIQGEREFGMQVLVVPMVEGKITYHSLILVPRSSEARSLLDLQGKRFASADILSNSGWLFPATWLVDHGHDPESFFNDHVFTGSHDRSVEAVALGYVDGAAVDSLVYDHMLIEDPSIETATKVIMTSPPFGIPPVVVPSTIDPALREHLLRAFLTMDKDPKGSQALADLKIERFVVPDANLYDSVRELVKAWESR